MPPQGIDRIKDPYYPPQVQGHQPLAQQHLYSQVHTITK